MAVNFRYSTKPNPSSVPTPDIYWEVDYGVVTDDGAGNDQNPPVSGNKVKRWTSKDASRHVVQQTTDASRPTYYVLADGRRYIEFPGTVGVSYSLENPSPFSVYTSMNALATYSLGVALLNPGIMPAGYRNFWYQGFGFGWTSVPSLLNLSGGGTFRAGGDGVGGGTLLSVNTVNSAGAQVDPYTVTAGETTFFGTFTTAATSQTVPAASTAKVYINGALNNTATGNATKFNSYGYYGIGSTPDASNSATRQFVGVYLYKSTLTDTQVLNAHYDINWRLFAPQTIDLEDVYARKYFFGSNTGYLWAWGGGQNGILGNNAGSNMSSPVQTVAGGSNWAQVAVGIVITACHMAAIKTDGTLWTWGSNSRGALADNTSVSKSSPIQTVVGGSWKSVACGYHSTLAIKTDGTLWGWGVTQGLGLGAGFPTQISSPVQVSGGGTTWRQCTTSGITLTTNTSAATKTDNTLWIWGATTGFFNYTAPMGSPSQVTIGPGSWSAVSTGSGSGDNIAAVATDGTLWVTGSNAYGQIGDNTAVTWQSSPVQTIAGGSNWSSVACGNSGIAAIKTDGTLWLWGRNQSGQLGDNTIVSKSSPVQTIAGGSNWKQVVASRRAGNFWAIKTNGTLWAWGDGSRGQLGDNTITAKSSPVQMIGNGIDWKSIVAGNYTVAAIKSS